LAKNVNLVFQTKEQFPIGLLKNGFQRQRCASLVDLEPLIQYATETAFKNLPTDETSDLEKGDE
jgi:hypothetical protein